MGPWMNFSEALYALKAGQRVRRAGWNGKGMWVCYMPPVSISEALINGRTKTFWPEGDLPVGGYFVMRTADGTWQPGWLASQTDILASDWEVFGG